ncbi:MAG TPA: STAS domain-containing protein [Casimicrobiaceae bacterium]|nr:STAS domain-containing protein [Casimicrobiaceae bacterium]
MTARASSPGESLAGFSADGAGARWSYSGSLSFANAARVFEAAAALPLPSAGEVDLSGVVAVDSSAVAVLLALSRRALEEGKPLAFTGVPAALRALADLYSVEDLLAA